MSHEKRKHINENAEDKIDDQENSGQILSYKHENMIETKGKEIQFFEMCIWFYIVRFFKENIVTCEIVFVL